MILHFCSPLGSAASVLFWPRRRKPHGSRVEGQLFRSFTSICDCGTSESLEESCSQDKEVLRSCLGQTSLIAPWRWTEAPKPSSKQNCSVLGEIQVQTPTSTGERGWQMITLLHLRWEIGLLRTMIFLLPVLVGLTVLNSSPQVAQQPLAPRGTKGQLITTTTSGPYYLACFCNCFVLRLKA